MTAIALSATEKSANKSAEEACNEKKVRRWRIAVVCLLFLFTTAAVGIGILLILNSHSADGNSDVVCSSGNNTRVEWIYWTRVSGDVDVHESALIDPDERTALMVSSEAYKINAKNSLALHDYTKGYVALRDYNMCLVSKVTNADFETVRNMLRERQGKRLPLQPERFVYLRSHQMTSSELGKKLSAFCQGVSAHWFDEVPKGVYRRDRRNVIDSKFMCLKFCNSFMTSQTDQRLTDKLSLYNKLPN